ncbi:MAG: DUF58 domain-containing protein [Candidatus Eremiobacteraeota bacterium]|nr:DUF58 domain-containing protein [Candidatus Eremiobacteraeota bacterium]
MRALWLNAWFSPRCFWAIGFGATVVALGSVSRIALWLGGIALLATIVLIAADFVLGPRRASIIAQRLETGHFAMRVRTDLRYEVRNESNRFCRIGLFETPIANLEIDEDEITADLPPRSSVQLDRDVLPRARGTAQLGAVYLWYENALGFIRRRMRIDLSTSVRVYPDLSLVERYGKLHARNRLIEAGLRKMRLVGVGTELESLREWTDGDQFRAINWKASARRGKLIVTHYDVERSQNVMLLLDCGRLMSARIDEQRKLDYAITAALSVARIADLANDKVGFVAFANHIIAASPPQSGKRGLTAASQQLYDLEPRFEESDYARAFLYVRSHVQKRSLIVLFTDMFDPVSAATILLDIGVLARRHLVVCVLMSDAAIETGLAAAPREPQDVYRAAVAATLAEERRAARAVLTRAGVRVVDAPASKLTVALIDAYLDVKQRGLL